MVLSKMMVSSLAELKVQRMVPTKCLAKKRVVQRLMVLWKVHLKVASLAEQKVQRKVSTKCLAKKRVVQRLMVARLECLIHLAHPKVANLAEMKWKVQWKGSEK